MLQGMLLVGFSKEHGDAASRWLQQMEPGFLISYCTADILAGTVQQAVMTGCDSLQFRQEEHEQVDEVLPRLVLLSGMSGEEAIAIAEHWEQFTGTSNSITDCLAHALALRCIMGVSGACESFVVPASPDSLHHAGV